MHGRKNIKLQLLIYNHSMCKKESSTLECKHGSVTLSLQVNINTNELKPISVFASYMPVFPTVFLWYKRAVRFSIL